MGHLWIVFSFLMPMIPTVQGSHELLTNKSALMELSNYLMDGYNKAVRPAKNWRKPTTVYVKIAIYAILGVDEKNQLVKSYIHYNQSWKDEFLQWDPTKFDNLTRISIPTQSIWLPDIMIEEAVGPKESPDVPYVYVHNDGRVINNNPIRITTSCNFDVYYFPFDILNCSISFSSWLHTTQDINISFGRIPHDINKLLNPHITEGEWDLLSVVPKYRELVDHDHKFGEITFYIGLKRQPLFYSVNLILPSALFMIMDTIGFYIPPESGERISFKITLLLGYSVFLVIATDTLPAVGAPLIGIYFSLCMILLMINLTESIFVVGILHKKSLFTQVPGWLQKLALEKMARVLLIKDSISPTCNYNGETSGKTEKITVDSLSNYCNRRTYDCNVLEQETWKHNNNTETMNSIVNEVESTWKHKNKPKQNNDWLLVAYVLDTLFFRLYLTILIIFALTMICLWSN